MRPPRPDVLVVGAGAFGLSTALALRARGRSVTVVDPGPIPHPDASSTDISKIVRMDYGPDAFYARLAETALERWRAWNEEALAPMYHETGFLLMADRRLEPGVFEHESRAVLEDMGHRVERLGGAALHARFPTWPADAWHDGYFNPAAGWAESGRAVGRLAERAAAAGVEVRPGVRVVGFSLASDDTPAGGPVGPVDGRIRGVVTDRGVLLEAETVVVAAGAWTPGLLPELRDVMRVVGQPVFHLRPDDTAPFRGEVFPVWAGDITRTGWYGFPVAAAVMADGVVADGVVKVANHGNGIPVDPAKGIPVVPDSWDGHLRRFLRDKLPALADAPIAARRLCLYCDTADGDFWIDRHPRAENLVVAAGGSGHGFKFMPVIGDVVADVLDGRENPWAWRFRWRTPDHGRREHARFLGDTFEG